MDYFSLLHTIFNYGKKINARGEETIELIDYMLTLEGYNLCWTHTHRPIEKVLGYLYNELAWYWSGERSFKFIAQHAKLWGEIVNPNETLNSNYGNLVYYKRNYNHDIMKDGMTGFEWALTNLMYDKESRKAVILYNDRCFNFMENKDYICTQQQHFLIRDNELICIIYLRSSDAIFGLSFNMPWWSLVHQDLWLRLKMKYPELLLGKITVHIGSAHIYKRHYQLVRNMLLDNKEYSFIRLKKPIELNKDIGEYLDQMFDYTELRRNNDQK